MKHVIYKFRLPRDTVPLNGCFTHPKGFKFLDADVESAHDTEQPDIILWAVGDPTQPFVTRRYRILFTGEEFDPKDMYAFYYLKTIRVKGYVAHIYLSIATTPIYPKEHP